MTASVYTETTSTQGVTESAQRVAASGYTQTTSMRNVMESGYTETTSMQRVVFMRADFGAEMTP